MQDPSEVTWRTSFASEDMPNFGLDESLDQPFRVYILRCGQKRFYVGVAHASELRERLTAQFRGQGALFTREHRATEVCAILPAVSRAVEALAYFSLLAKFDESYLIGGWVQTCAKLTPLGYLLVREARANLNSRCFTCGGSGHMADTCPKRATAEKTCFYDCPMCSNRLYLNTRGITPNRLSAPSQALSVAGHERASQPRLPLQEQEQGQVHQQPQQQQPEPQQQQQQQPEQQPPQAEPQQQQQPQRQQPQQQQQPQQPPRRAVCSFEQCWGSARAKRRRRNQQEIRSLKDVVAKMGSGGSSRALPTLRERANVWARRYGWQTPRDYEVSVPEFQARGGGGSPGVGVCKTAAASVYEELNKA